MGLFGLLNYEDYILKSLVKSNYAKNSLVVLLLCIVTGLIRFHLSILLCYIFKLNNNFDMIFPIIITCLLSMISDIIYKYVETHRSTYENIVDYFMDNYSEKNLVKWKRYFFITIWSYTLLAILLVSIDNYFILLSVVQAAISFCISDFIENKIPNKWYDKFIMNIFYKPKILHPIQESIIDNYQRVTQIPTKPPTPPRSK